MPPFIRYPDVKKLTHQVTEYLVEYLQAFDTSAEE
jgi:hypothetical protein